MANMFSPAQAQFTPMGASPARGGPFSNLFTPDSPSPIFATIGHALGNPSREEVRAQELGVAQGGVLGALSQAMERGRTPQQSLLDLMQTDEGIDYFAKGGDLKTLVDYMASATPPTQDPMNIAPGGSVFMPGQGEVYRNPTTEAQEFDEFTNFAMLTESEKAELAKAKLYKEQTGDPTQEEAAWGRLVENGVVTPGQADLALAGAIEFVRDPTTGETIFRNSIPALQETMPAPAIPGTGVAPLGFNLNDQGVPPVGAPAPAVSAPQQPSVVTPAGGSTFAPATNDQLAQSQPATPAMPESTDIGEIDPLDITTNDARIIRGAGWFRGLQSSLGNTIGPLVPGTSAPVVQAMRGAMQEIEVLTNQIPVRAGSRLAADIKSLQKLSEFEGKTPEGYGAQLIRLYGLTESLIKQAETIATNPSSSIEMKKEAEAQIYSLMTLRNGLPNPEDLRREIEAVKTEGGQATPFLTPKAQQAIEGLESEIQGKAKPNGKQPAGLTFGTVNEVYDAVKSGRVKNGDKVIVNGKEKTISFGDK